MSKKCDGLDWFNENIKPLLGDEFELKYVNEENGDLGSLTGVQFDSEEKGGYIYFWSSGHIGFQLVDYEEGIEIVEDTIQELASKSYEQVFDALLAGLT